MLWQVLLWVVFALGALMIVANWCCLVASCRRRDGHHISMLPVFGGVFAFAASAGLPVGWKLGAIALVADPACVPMLVAFAVVSVREQLRGA